MAKSLTVVARVRAKSGREEQVRAALLTLVEPTRAEAGCVTYEVHRSLDDPAQFFFHEIWASHDLWQAHLQMPHVQALLDKAGELLAEPPEITLWEEIS